jgi:hypothetical protein
VFGVFCISEQCGDSFRFPRNFFSPLLRKRLIKRSGVVLLVFGSGARPFCIVFLGSWLNDSQKLENRLPKLVDVEITIC